MLSAGPQSPSAPASTPDLHAGAAPANQLPAGMAAEDGASDGAAVGALVAALVDLERRLPQQVGFLSVSYSGN